MLLFLLLPAACVCPSERESLAFEAVSLADETLEVIEADYVGVCFCEPFHGDEDRLAEARMKRLGAIKAVRDAIAELRAREK